MLKKKTVNWYGKNYYYLGKDANGKKYYLAHPSWDCDWYWGFGYITTFSNNNCPEKSMDLDSWSHFDNMFLNKNKYGGDVFKEFFKEYTIKESQVYDLIDYMTSFYALREAAEILGRGYSNITERAKSSLLIDKDEVAKINDVMIPELEERIIKLLTGEDVKVEKVKY